MTEEKKPLVSVVCLCYNHCDTVAQTIEGIVNQKTDFSFELIIHDDASTDNTAEIITEYAKKYPDIIVPVLQKENQMSRCNIAESIISPILRGSFVAICEGDDFWTSPDKLQSQVDIMKSDPEITMCFHAINELFDNGDMRVYRPLKESGTVPAGLIVKRGGMFCPSVSLMFTIKTAQMWPQFRKSADVYDYPQQVLCATEGKVYYIDEIMGTYRASHAGSWTAERKKKTDFKHLENETNWLLLFNEYTNGRFSDEINYHFAHLWFTEYRKNRSKNIKAKVREYSKKLHKKDRAVFFLLTLFFGVFGESANAVWEKAKQILLK